MAELIDIPHPGAAMYYGEVGRPLVVVVHDWYGRLPALEPLGQALARNGFRVAIPDLYNGVATVDDETADSLMDQLNAETSIGIIDGLIVQARTQGSSRIGLVGFSMGGWLALGAAQLGLCDAVVAYYATLGVEEHDILPCPVLLQLAEYDDWGPGGDPESFISRLKDHGTPVGEFTYIGTQHSFANASIPDKVDVNAATLAFARTVSFLERHLAD